MTQATRTRRMLPSLTPFLYSILCITFVAYAAIMVVPARADSHVGSPRTAVALSEQGTTAYWGCFGPYYMIGVSMEICGERLVQGSVSTCSYYAFTDGDESNIYWQVDGVPVPNQNGAVVAIVTPTSNFIIDALYKVNGGVLNWAGMEVTVGPEGSC